MVFNNLLKRLKPGTLALLFLLTQASLALTPFINVGTASAAGQITFGPQFENQTYPDNPSIWTNGQLDNYSEGDFVNFRFQIDASDSTSAGTMFIEYDLSSCNFFTDYFELVSTTPDIVDITKGTQTLIDPSGNNNEFYRQNLDVDFTSAGITTIIFTLQLSDTAGECTGSNTGVRLGVPDEGAGDFANAGAKTLPMSANSVLENPSLTITKTVTGGNALPSDFYFTVSPAINGLNEVHIPTGQDSVTINEINPDGVFVITEHGPSGYTFSGGTGTNCSVTSEGVMTATVEAQSSDPINAICNFSNELDTGSLTITKNSIPDGSQDFDFTSDIPNYETFTLDDETGDSTDNVPESITVNQLAADTYTITEQPQNGWYLNAVDCSGTDSEVVNLETGTVTVTVSSNDTIDCEFTNRKYGTITVNKQTYPESDTTDFTITASTSDGIIVENPEQIISNGEQIVYTVTQNGTYSVNESDVIGGGWVQNDSDCQNLVITYSQLTQECTIYNRKVPKLTLIKNVIIDSSNDDAVPSDFTLLLTGGEYDKSEFTSGDTPAVAYDVEYTVGEKMDEVFGYKYIGTECVDDNTQDVLSNPFILAPGQEVTCMVTNDDISPLLTLVKNVENDYGDPADANDWVLSAIAGENNWDAPDLSGDGNPGDGDGVDEATAYANLIYTLTEASNITGYTTGNWVCEGDGGTQDGDSGEFLTLSIGAIVTCTITNTADAPQLTVIKQVVNNNGGSAVAGDFTMNVTATNPSDSSFPGDETGTTITLDEGNYSVDENTYDGYTKNLGVGCTGSIAVGEHKTCTITNDDDAPSLTLVKQLNNDNGGERNADEWTLTATGTLESPTNLSGAGGATSGTDFKADTYTLAETGPDDYEAGSWVCNNGITVNENNEVTILNGQSTTCTITNDDIAPSLTLNKVVVNDNGGTASENEWTITATGATTLSGPGASGDADVVSDASFSAGTYTLSESGGPSGYTASEWSCTNDVTVNGKYQITLANGQSTVCTIINSAVPDTGGGQVLGDSTTRQVVQEDVQVLADTGDTHTLFVAVIASVLLMTTFFTVRPREFN